MLMHDHFGHLFMLLTTIVLIIFKWTVSLTFDVAATFMDNLRTGPFFGL